MSHGKIKVKSILSLSLILLLTGCKNSSNINTVYSIRDSVWSNLATTMQEKSTEVLGTDKEITSVTDNTKYKEYADGEKYTYVAPNGEVYEMQYKEYHPKVSDVKYGKVGETVICNGYEFCIEEALYTDTWNSLYDMVDKGTAEEYIRYVRDESNMSSTIDGSNAFIYTDTARTDGGYRIGLLLIKFKIKNVSGIARTQKIAANLIDITTSKVVEVGSGFNPSCFLGQHDNVLIKNVGLVEKYTHIDLKDGEEREIIYPCIYNYTVDKEINYGRNYTYDRIVYITTEFLKYAEGGGSQDVSAGSYLIPIVDHGVVCGSGQKLE